MADTWIKALGTSENQLADDWRSERGGLFKDAITFKSKPGLRKGDGVVLYATGTGLIFAVGTVTSHPYLPAGESDSGWPWIVNVEYQRSRPFIHDGELLEVLNVEDRDLRKVIKRRSHVRLSEAEFEAAVQALRN
ncbi:MAG: hypothetical protein ACOYD4_08355 [Solirubrobacterales bacterium]